jgi:pyruvate carboxylase
MSCPTPNFAKGSLEAMKMQSTIYAPKAGRVSRILVEAGQQVEAKELLLTIE